MYIMYAENNQYASKSERKGVIAVGWGYNKKYIVKDYLVKSNWEEISNKVDIDDCFDYENEIKKSKFATASEITERYLNLVCNNVFDLYIEIDENGIAHKLSNKCKKSKMTLEEIEELENFYKKTAQAG